MKYFFVTRVNEKANKDFNSKMSRLTNLLLSTPSKVVFTKILLDKEMHDAEKRG